MKLREESIEALTTEGIPGYMHSAIINYYENGWPPGGFLSSLIDNNLKETFGHADDTNVHRIKNYVMWFYNYAPGGTWGYEGAVENWCLSFKKSEELL